LKFGFSAVTALHNIQVGRSQINFVLNGFCYCVIWTVWSRIHHQDRNLRVIASFFQCRGSVSKVLHGCSVRRTCFWLYDAIKM